MIRTARYIIVTACAAAVAAVPLSAQQDLGRDGTTWNWDGPLASGGSLRVFNINGALHFTPSSDGSVHVKVVKHVHSGGDPTVVHYAVVRSGNDVTICAMWNDAATCDSRGMNSNNDNDNGGDRRRNVTAEFSVQVPDGVRTNGNTINGEVTVDRIGGDVRANTINGTVRVTDVTGDVRAHSVNGDVAVETRGGTVSAETVNGSVRASMGSSGTGDMRFRTVNGSIELKTPSPFNATVHLGTVNGSIDTRFSLNFDRFRKRADGTIGSGGRRLDASSINASVTLQ